MLYYDIVIISSNKYLTGDKIANHSSSGAFIVPMTQEQVVIAQGALYHVELNLDSMIENVDGIKSVYPEEFRASFGEQGPHVDLAYAFLANYLESDDADNFDMDNFSLQFNYHIDNRGLLIKIATNTTFVVMT